MLLEEAAQSSSDDEPYDLPIIGPIAAGGLPWTIDTRPMIGRIAREIASGRSAPRVSHCFHRSIAHMIERACSWNSRN